MLVTQSDAKKIIRAAYGDSFEFRLTTQCNMGVRPVHEIAIGKPMLAWRKLTSGNSAVAIGQLFTDGRIDWNYTL